ncbi:MAG: hypothetical protein A2W28_07130 [Gammaproteobacteria bacterium RBG_16_51_14]|nr:MAG: hypothetical protein A2W28_07130 [Gammaproteobacteria bacterium RBG_16_51_14]
MKTQRNEMSYPQEIWRWVLAQDTFRRNQNSSIKQVGFAGEGGFIARLAEFCAICQFSTRRGV